MKRPFWEITGATITKRPKNARPLNGFDFDTIQQESEKYYIKLREYVDGWYDSFPNCCSSCEELAKKPGFNKEDYSYIPEKIIRQFAYLMHFIEELVDHEHWQKEIFDYIDYLEDSFGIPAIGYRVFVDLVVFSLDKVEFKDKDFPTDKIEKIKAFILKQNNESKIENPISFNELFDVFQKWLRYMPKFGSFVEMKEQLTGKFPLDFFTTNKSYNRYLGLQSFRVLSIEDSILKLKNVTKSRLSAINTAELINKGIISYDDKMILEVAGEKLRVKQAKILEITDHKDGELEYIEIAEKWLENELEYFQTLGDIFNNKDPEILKRLSEIHLNTVELLDRFSEFKILLNLLSDDLQVAADSLFSEIENLSHKDLSENEIEILSAKISNLIKDRNELPSEVNSLHDRLSDSEISVKHKLKFSVPLFFFLKYESELEVSNKQKIPKSFKEFRSLFLRKVD